MCNENVPKERGGEGGGARELKNTLKANAQKPKCETHQLISFQIFNLIRLHGINQYHYANEFRPKFPFHSVTQLYVRTTNEKHANILLIRNTTRFPNSFNL